jgi:hypothetical protein
MRRPSKKAYLKKSALSLSGTELGGGEDTWPRCMVWPGS